jgi:hypothetical protein
MKEADEYDNEINKKTGNWKKHVMKSENGISIPHL